MIQKMRVSILERKLMKCWQICAGGRGEVCIPLWHHSDWKWRFFSKNQIKNEALVGTVPQALNAIIHPSIHPEPCACEQALWPLVCYSLQPSKAHVSSTALMTRSSRIQGKKDPSKNGISFSGVSWNESPKAWCPGICFQVSGVLHSGRAGLWPFWFLFAVTLSP